MVKLQFATETASSIEVLNLRSALTPTRLFQLPGQNAGFEGEGVGRFFHVLMGYGYVKRAKHRTKPTPPFRIRTASGRDREGRCVLRGGHSPPNRETSSNYSP
jgi:hypothetical protein